MMVLRAQVLRRCAFLPGEKAIFGSAYPQSCVSSWTLLLAGRRMSDPSLPHHRSPSVAAQRRQPPTATATATTTLPPHPARSESLYLFDFAHVEDVSRFSPSLRRRTEPPSPLQEDLPQKSSPRAWSEDMHLSPCHPLRPTLSKAQRARAPCRSPGSRGPAPPSLIQLTRHAKDVPPPRRRDAGDRERDGALGRGDGKRGRGWRDALNLRPKGAPRGPDSLPPELLMAWKSWRGAG